MKWPCDEKYMRLCSIYVSTKDRCSCELIAKVCKACCCRALRADYSNHRLHAVLAPSQRSLSIFLDDFVARLYILW